MNSWISIHLCLWDSQMNKIAFIKSWNPPFLRRSWFVKTKIMGREIVNRTLSMMQGGYFLRLCGKMWQHLSPLVVDYLCVYWPNVIVGCLVQPHNRPFNDTFNIHADQSAISPNTTPYKHFNVVRRILSAGVCMTFRYAITPLLLFLSDISIRRGAMRPH